MRVQNLISAPAPPLENVISTQQLHVVMFHSIYKNLKNGRCLMPVNIRVSSKQIDTLACIANTGFKQLSEDQLEMIQALFSRIVLATVAKVQAEENEISATLTVSINQ